MLAASAIIVRLTLTPPALESPAAVDRARPCKRFTHHRTVCDGLASARKPRSRGQEPDVAGDVRHRAGEREHRAVLDQPGSKSERPSRWSAQACGAPIIDALTYLHLPVSGTPPPLGSREPFKAVVVLEQHAPAEWRNQGSDGLIQDGCLYMMAWGCSCLS